MMATAWEYLVALQRHLEPLPLPRADCTGKTIIVTGANTGLGQEAARVILECRDMAEGEAARTAITASLCEASSSSSSSSHRDKNKGGPGPRTTTPNRLEVWELDQGSFASVRAFAGRTAAELLCLP